MRKKKLAGIVGIVMLLLLGVSSVACVAEEFGWPLPGHTYITATYTYPSSGTRHKCRYSTPDGRAAGIDIGVDIGTEVFAPAAGTVQNLYYQSNGFGNHFEILHDDGTITLYAHLSEYKVQNGQRVNRGDLIALTGNTGGDYGPHLHYEMKDIDGYQYYQTYGYRDPREMAGASDAREKVVAHAYEILNYEWRTDGYIVLHDRRYEPDTEYDSPAPALFSAHKPILATGTLRGIPYTLSANGNGREMSFSEYKTLTDEQKLLVSNVYGYGNNGVWKNGGWAVYPTIQYWRVGMKYGMSCATFVWDCVSQALPVTRTAGSPNIPSLWADYLTKTNYSELKKGDILQKSAHVMLVVDNNPSEGYLTVVEQTPPDIGTISDAGSIYLPPHGYYKSSLYNTYTVGTREKSYWYSELSSYTAYSVKYDGISPYDDPNRDDINPGLQRLTSGSYAKAFTLSSERVNVYTDSSLRTLMSGNYTGYDEEDYITYVGKNSGGTVYAQISIPTDSGGRKTAYVKLSEFVPGSILSDAKTATAKSGALYKRKNSGQNNDYWIDPEDSVYLLTKEDGWTQVMYPISGASYWRIAWMPESEYKRIVPDDDNDGIPIDSAHFPDSKLRECLMQDFDRDSNGYLSDSEIADAKSFQYTEYKGISSLEGIKYLANLEWLYIPDNHITQLDVSGLQKLGTICCWNNDMKSINADNCPSLKELWAGSCKSLQSVYIRNNAQMTLLYIDNCSVLSNIYAGGSPKLSSFNLSGCDKLAKFEKDSAVNLSSYLPKFSTSSLPDGYVGENYSATVKATGTGVITYSSTQLALFMTNGFYFESDYLMSNTTGKIAGTPIIAASRKYTITASNFAGESQKDYTITVTNRGKGPEIITESIPELIKGQYYSIPITETGGILPITWQRAGGTLPDGMSLSSSTGRTVYLQGNPTKAADYTFKIEAYDGTKTLVRNLPLRAIKAFTVSVKEPIAPSISTSSLPDGKVGESYSTALTATGTTPITFSAAGLPSGLSCSSAGKITGTPSSAGTYTVRITAKNTAGSASRTLSLTIKSIPVALTFDVYLPTCYLGEEYNGWIRVSGTAPVTCIVSGLPSGLSKNSGGSTNGTTKIETYTVSITGKAKTAGTYTIKVNASNSVGSVSKSYSLTVKTRPVVPSITTTSLPQGKVNTAYSATLSATGTTPISWSATGLPSGLSCSNEGKITGTPTQSGTFTVKITASNSAGNDTRSLTLSIASSGNSEIIAPEAGDDELVPEFKTHNLTLTGKISMNFYMNLPEIQGVNYMDGAKCYMEFDISGDKSNNPQPHDPKFTNSSGAYYGFTCYVNSVQMADDIKAVFHYGQNKSVSQIYTMKQYFDNILAKSTTSSESRNLMTAMVDYGHYMQLFLSSVNGWKLGTAHKPIECVNVYTEADIEKVKNLVRDYAIVRNTGNSGIEKVTFALELDSDTRINVYLAVKSDYRGNVSATLDGGTANVAVKQPDGRYMVQIADIPAHRLGDTHTIRVTAGEEFDVKVSALSYVHSKLNSATADSDARKAVVSLYNYYAASVAYGKSTGQY